VNVIARPPTLTGIHHFSPTVSDVEASARWYQRVFGMERYPMPFPHHGDEGGGFGIVLRDPRSGLVIGLHHHRDGHGESFDERRTGLDHIAFAVSTRADLTRWAAWLDELAISHSGVTDVTEPMRYSTLVFRDPDNIQLEITFVAAAPDQPSS
jgi:glyoxylase I family protein